MIASLSLGTVIGLKEYVFEHRTHKHSMSGATPGGTLTVLDSLLRVVMKHGRRLLASNVTKGP